MILKNVVLFFSLLSIAASAKGSCLGSGDAEIEALAKNIGRQPNQALLEIERTLSDDLTLTLERRTWLEAARAQAQRMIGVEKSELPLAIEKATALPPGHPALLHLQVANLYGANLAESNFEVVDAMKQTFSQLSPTQPSTICLKVRLASVMADYIALNGDSFELAAEAFRFAEKGGYSWIQAEATSVMGQVVLRTDGDFGRLLSQKSLQYFESQGMHDMVANELFMLGLSWGKEQNADSWQQAYSHFQNSLLAAQRAENHLATAYAQAGLCDVFVRLNRVKEALHTCHQSLEKLKGIGHVTESSTLVNYAEVLYLDGRPQEALTILEALSGRHRYGHNGYRYYLVSGQVNEILGNAAQAIADLKSALNALSGYESSTRARSNRLFQSRFRVEQLQQSLALKEKESEQKEHRNRIIFVSALIMLSLLMITLITLLKHRKLYKSMAFIDPLTGLANRRYTLMRAQEAFKHARSRKQSFYIALIDLDNFKKCNDQFGHEAGDEVLKQFARVAESTVRTGDVMGRWGGEEFLLLLQGVDYANALKLLERLRSAAAEIRLTLAPEYPVQFSVGIVDSSEPVESLEELINLADKALYRAKSEGRNRSCLFQSAPAQ